MTLGFGVFLDFAITEAVRCARDRITPQVSYLSFKCNIAVP